MWILLLDKSSSMNDPFGKEAPAVPAGGRKVVTRADRKFTAAREALLDYVAGLPPMDRIALFCFDRTATLVFDGVANERARLETALRGVEPDGSTDIAAAFDAAAAHLEKVGRRATEMHQTLLVSDGLSDPEAARSAAERLALLVPLIHVILIDPTEKGHLTAQAVLRGSSLVKVESAAQLERETTRIASAQAAVAREFQEVTEKVEKAAAEARG